MNDSTLIEKQAQHDLMVVAWHEAAHLVVAHDCGAPAHVEVWPSDSTDPALMAWRGNCKADTSGLSRYQRSLVALAGIIGEQLAVGIDNVDDIVCEIEYDDSAISDTDHQMMEGRTITRAMLVKATLRVLKLRKEIEAEANWLIRGAEGSVATTATQNDT